MDILNKHEGDEIAMKIKFRALYLLIALMLPIPLNYILAYIQNYVKRTYSMPFLGIAFVMLGYFLIGAFIGFDRLTININMKGKWRIKPTRSAIGIGFILLSIVINMPFNMVLYELFYRYRDMFYTWMIISGYLVTTSLEKNITES